METNNVIQFSPRQKRIISLLIRKFSHKQIALELHISDSAVADHFLRIRQKLKVDSDVAIVLAVLDIYFNRKGEYIGPPDTV